MNWPLPNPLSLSPEAGMAVAFQFDSSSDTRKLLVDQGLWWVLPIGRRREEIWGLRVEPARPLADFSLVKVAEGQVKTIGSNIACLVPLILFPGTVLEPRFWNAVLDMPSSLWAEFEALYRATGGTDALRGTRELLGRESVRDALVIGAQPDALAAGMKTALRAIDPSVVTSTYLEYLHQAVIELDAPVPLPEVGPWVAAAASVAFSAAPLDKTFADERTAPAAWALLQQPAGLDCFQGDTPSFIVEPRGSMAQLVEAAQALHDSAETNAALQTSPLWPVVAEIADQGDAYIGASHLEAAGALAPNSPAAAFSALCSASSWFARAGSGPLKKAPDAAIALSERHGWQDVARCLLANVQADHV